MSTDIAKPGDRPGEFPMSIQGGMIEALGINMYTTLGKCLVEFVANAYDSDSSVVDITIPVDEIERERKAVRERAKKEVADGTREPFSILLVPLPDTLQVVISDNGHGMRPDDIATKFLPINRHRRRDTTGKETNLKSESNDRFVMGRKGLGKLAGFGAAERVTVSTKREGDSFSTSITMDLNKLMNAENLATVNIPASYVDAQPLASKGTTIILSLLKCDAARYGLDTITNTIADAFYGINPSVFEVRINGSRVQKAPAEYEYYWPEVRPHDELARTSVSLDGIQPIEFDYVVKFRKRGQNLPAAQRGARIYCNNRLAAGPSLLGLPTGMHNFHSQSYMEAIVRADSFDRQLVDLVNTNRTQLREDNEMVTVFLDMVTQIMKDALAAHGRHRDKVVEEEITSKPETKAVMATLEHVPNKMRTPAKKLIKSLAVQYGTESNEFQELSPLVIQSMNAGDILIRLIELGSDPGDLERVTRHLLELSTIERADVLKLYRGRRSGILALQGLIKDGEDLWISGPRSENKLHQLLKENPWIIKPEIANYLTSDADIGKTVTALARALKVDSFHESDAGGEPDRDRPDLVFLLGDSAAPHIILVVELKSPNLPLNTDHLQQLKGYMRRVDQWVKTEYKRRVVVQGYLVGAMPESDSRSQKCLDLIYEIDQAPLNSNWEVIGLQDLLQRAYQIHIDAIKALERDEAEGRL